MRSSRSWPAGLMAVAGIVAAGGLAGVPTLAATPLPGGTAASTATPVDHDDRDDRAAGAVATTAVAPVSPVSLDALPAPLAELLSRLPEADAMRLRRHAVRWQAWSPPQRAAFAERVVGWDGLDADTRGGRREAWHAWQALPEPQRERLGEMARGFAQRPEAERAELRKRFAALPREQRRGWLLGPALGADYPLLHPLLAQLPAEQQAPLLDVLHSMSAAQRRQLGVLVQRTPPQARDALRRELIATPGERLQQWLWERLER
ncbi:DUF3106 domain-containing protein [Marilutibacter maris]|nr:DUF3106 domain-containing protein [Lysobacter maris]